MEKPMKSESPTLLSLTDSSETEWSFYSNLRPNGSIIRKRKIDPLNEPVTVFDNSDEGPTKTRRVNPQRLAGRLDPDLVEEMEALIIPGAKMPTFPVRKDFQERYNVDRRHIYDYFHSRGLRVAKEDKHTNLVRGRSLKADALPVATKVLEIHPSEAPELPKSRKILPSSSEFARVKPLKVSTKPCAKKPGRQPGRHPKKSLSSTHHTQPGPFTPPRMMLEKSRSSPCPEFTLPQNLDHVVLSGDILQDSDFLELVAAQADMLHQQLDEVFLEDLDSGIPYYQATELLTPVDEHRLLNQKERMELYNFVNNSIGPTRGIQESAGTYDLHMKGRSNLFYNRLLSTSCRPGLGYTRLRSPGHQAQGLGQDGTEISNRSSTQTQQGDVNFRSWLSTLRSDGDKDGRDLNLDALDPTGGLSSRTALLSLDNLATLRESLQTAVHTILEQESLFVQPSLPFDFADPPLLPSNCLDTPVYMEDKDNPSMETDAYHPHHSFLQKRNALARSRSSLDVVAFDHRLPMSYPTDLVSIKHNLAIRPLDTPAGTHFPHHNTAFKSPTKDSSCGSRSLSGITKPSRLRTFSAGGGI